MIEVVKKLSEKLDVSAAELARLDGYWTGRQPAAFLAPESRQALGNRLDSVAVNFPKRAVMALAERLTVTGFRTEGEDTAPDTALWREWRRNRMMDASAQAHIDALVYGRSFVIVWAGPRGPQITVESPKQVAVVHDPATREVVAAFKRWQVEGEAHGFLYLPDRVLRLSSTSKITGDVFPSNNWQVAESIPNPLGVVPVVPIVNRGRLLDVDGTSEMSDLLGLTDALNKLSSDALVSSEFYARPRRFATGLELQEDEDGNLIQPFDNDAEKLWISESPDTKFGQFDGARLDGYSDLMATVTSQIGAISGLPPHFLGVHGDQPASADAIRSAEASLVARAYALQRTFGQSWADVAALVTAVRDGVDPLDVQLETVWADPETRTPAQAADSALKLSQIGVPLPIVLEQSLGYSPAQVDRVKEAMGAAAPAAVENVTTMIEGDAA